jgi:hypothetical protein
MSEPLNPNPGAAGGMGGPQPRPTGDGLPPNAGGEGHGVEGVGPEDSRAPGMEGEGGDRGEDVGGMEGEG